MNMKLEYKAYNFKYDLDELVVLKCTTEIKNINDTLDSVLKELDWYMSINGKREGYYI